MLRVLHVAPFFEPPYGFGGMARAAVQLVDACARIGHAITVVTAQFGSEPAIETRPSGVIVRRFPSPGWANRRLFPLGRLAAEWIRAHRHEFDVAHLHGHRSGLVLRCGRALRTLKLPYVLSTHGTYPRHGERVVAKSLVDVLARPIVVNASRVLVVSDAEKRDIPRDTVVIPNGVAPLRPPVPAVVKAASRLVFVGSAAWRKRLIDLARVLDSCPEVSLRCIGPCDSVRAAFERFAGRVHFAGSLPPALLAEELAVAQLMIHPAEAETFGMAQFEAALEGTPAIVRGGHGLGEWYRRAGGLVLSDQEFETPLLIEAIRRRLKDPMLCAAEASSVATFAQRELTWERAARETTTVYERIVRDRAA